MRRGRTAIGDGRRCPRKRRRRLVAVALAGLAAAACAGEPGEGPAEDPSGEPRAVVIPGGQAGDSAAAPDSTAVAPDSAAAADTVEDDRPALPPMPGEGAPREFRLLLVNPHEHEARVFASAGAARVALDTVPARDSTRVDVRVRSDRIVLEAEDAGGARIGSIELDLAPGRTNRWEIGPPPGPRVASARR